MESLLVLVMSKNQLWNLPQYPYWMIADITGNKYLKTISRNEDLEKLMGFLGGHAVLIIGFSLVSCFSVSLVAKSIILVASGCLYQVENGSMFHLMLFLAATLLELCVKRFQTNCVLQRVDSKQVEEELSQYL